MEPANEVQEVEQLQFPLVIAMKDVSGSNNQCSKIAQKLASFLKFPLIDQNDVTQAILNSTKTQIPNELAHSLPFEVVCQIASTQLNLKIKVVINSPISNDDHLDRLVQLARSREAHLIIIKCNSKDDYDVGKIPKLNIDTKSFDVRKVVSDLYIMLSHMEKDEVSKGKSIKENVGQDKNEVRQPINDHLHALILSNKPRKDKLVCTCCSKLLSGSSYHCIECDEFTLHKFCAESASNINILSYSPPPFLIGMQSDHYNFQKTYKCNKCEEFLHSCYDCLFLTHIRNGFVPTILNHKQQHPHFLNFIIIPPRYNYQYKCCICDKLGSSVSYKCFECNDYNYDVHVNCVLQETIIMRNGQLRFFLTSKSSPYYDPSKHPCDICKEFIEKGQLFYHCKVPKLKIHHKCMIRDEHRVDVLIKQKNSTQETGLPANLFGESFIEDILKSLPGVIPEDVDLLLKKHGKRERNFVG
eukprot:XP_025015098.1 uncharacterized protein LOC112536553 [Ricinus communis]